MKKFFLIFVNIIIVASVATFMYHSYVEELDSKLEVECEYTYIVNLNSMTFNCEVEDEDSIISDQSPLNIYVFDNNDLVVFESTLSSGNNNLNFNTLEYNSLYSISVLGYDYIKEEYILTNYSEFDFSTVKSDLTIPTCVLSQNYLSESEYHFSIDITDEETLVKSIDVSLYDHKNELVITENLTEFNNLDISFTDLDPEKQYSMIVQINYIINDFEELSKIIETTIFTTTKTQLSPTAELSNVYNDNMNLSFNLTTNTKDATDVLYTIDLIDLEKNILYTEIMNNSEVEIDVSSISGNYFISIKASYSLNGSSFSNIELDTYNIYSSELSNFFTLPTVAIVNTELPLTSYDDYSNYIFTFLNEGASEFSVVCQTPVNCGELVTNELYSGIPFIITDLVHSYNDINTINYSYTSTQLNITVGREYTIEEINIIDQEIDAILNSIINESMTDYEKILSVHDYIINNTVYDSNCFEDTTLCDNDHTAFGVLYDNEAVCEGYAHTMDIMLRALQIPTVRLSSNTHQWSAVYYNGGWYHLDATWDDPVTSNGDNVLSHKFFLLTSDELLSEDSSSRHIYESMFINFME